MNSSKESSRLSDKNINTIKWVVATAIIVAIAVIIMLVFRTHNKTTTITRDSADTSYISCLAGNPDDAFFTSKSAESISHEIKVIFSDDVVDKFSYTLRGTYNSNAAAMQDIAVWHADYNNYMADHNADPEKLSPHFTDIDTKSEISLYTLIGDMSSSTHQFFFLTDEEYSKIQNYSTEELQSLYKSKGFLCEIGQ